MLLLIRPLPIGPISRAIKLNWLQKTLSIVNTLETDQSVQVCRLPPKKFPYVIICVRKFSSHFEAKFLKEIYIIKANPLTRVNDILSDVRPLIWVVSCVITIHLYSQNTPLFCYARAQL